MKKFKKSLPASVAQSCILYMSLGVIAATSAGRSLTRAGGDHVPPLARQSWEGQHMPLANYAFTIIGQWADKRGCVARRLCWQTSAT